MGHLVWLALPVVVLSVPRVGLDASAEIKEVFLGHHVYLTYLFHL